MSFRSYKRNTCLLRVGRLVLAWMLALYLSSCSIQSTKSYGDQVVAGNRTVEHMRASYGADPTVWATPSYMLSNGNAVYIEPIGRSVGYKGCEYHWEVNPQGYVVGYKAVGNRCW